MWTNPCSRASPCQSKTSGMQATGGTLNTSGSFTLRVTHTGADTMLARIIRMVEAAQGARLPIQALVDRVTGWFVPAVMGVALLTFLLWLFLGPRQPCRTRWSMPWPC